MSGDKSAASPAATCARVYQLPARKVSAAPPSGRHLEKRQLALGFIPLTDCAPLIVAREKGFFARRGLFVELSRESSWANIRDKVCTGMLDGAQMLAAMPLASAVDDRHCQPMVTALSLDLNGNAITVSKELYGRLLATGADELDTARGSARALKQVIEQDRAAGRPKLTFAVVYPESSHNYLLRYWMADAGIDPDADVRLTVVPPPQVGHYLRAGLIAGYCVGEPWNTHAVSQGLGRTLITSHDIWNNHPEKVFAVTRTWAQSNPNTHQAVVTALLEACVWLDDPVNRRETCELLSQGRYVNAPVDILEKSLMGTLQFSSDEQPRAAPDYNVFHRYAANFPWRSHALWFLSQMVRWGQLEEIIDHDAIANAVYRPDVFRAAAAVLRLPCPETDYKIEGLHESVWTLAHGEETLAMGPDLFMDGRRFDPAGFRDYVEGFAISRFRAGIRSADATGRVRAPDFVETAI
jgi:nitrate/nitrite transport system substrate-binding protein